MSCMPVRIGTLRLLPDLLPRGWISPAVWSPARAQRHATECATAPTAWSALGPETRARLGRDQGRLVALESPNEYAHIFLNLASPNDLATPPKRFEGLDSTSITLSVSLELWPPVFGIRLRRTTGSASMPVPETSVDEDGHSVLWEDDVGGPRERSMQSKAEPCGVQTSPNARLRRRVPRPHSGHGRTPLGRR